MNDLTNPSTNDETTLPFFLIMIQHWPNQFSLLLLILTRFDAHLYFAYSPPKQKTYSDDVVPLVPHFSISEPGTTAPDRISNSSGLSPGDPVGLVP